MKFWHHIGLVMLQMLSQAEAEDAMSSEVKVELTRSDSSARIYFKFKPCSGHQIENIINRKAVFFAVTCGY